MTDPLRSVWAVCVFLALVAAFSAVLISAHRAHQQHAALVRLAARDLALDDAIATMEDSRQVLQDVNAVIRVDARNRELAIDTARARPDLLICVGALCGIPSEWDRWNRELAILHGGGGTAR